ncbi:MAG: cytochrome c biogenesis protein CcsA, partial [Saprospiraceae bacterium]
HRPSLKEGIRLWSTDQHPDFHQAKRSLFPYRNILVETIRNTFYHVSLWFAMFLMFGMSVYFSYRVLKYQDLDADLRSYALVRTGFFFGILGCLTGSLWARFTWETWWTTDIKLNMAALTMLIYLAYLVLRASIDDLDRKARISSAYNIFALVAVIPLIFVLPRLTDSLHPGNGGNPAIGADDMDNALRIIFYPAVLAFMLIGLWMASLLYRSDKISNFIEEKYNN